MKTTKLIFTLALGILIQNAFAQTGADFYKAYCVRCHTIGNGNLVGPDLKGTMKKYDEQWLIKWIRSSQTLINEGDEKAKALFEKYNELQMADNDLTDDEIKSIIVYVDEQSGGATTASVSASAATTAEQNTNTATETKTTAAIITNTADSNNNSSANSSSNSVTVIMIAAAIVIMITVVILARTVLVLTALYKRDSEFKKAA